ncbi:16S rRNA (guanine(966)-N(2))-methyltransferase RsmD [Sinomonas atrocyanea]|jgi:16S rRNA (guanine966-N2)-methyltransferase|uniref:16S rRNA (guanine(966)-N(2))-methyltransferase RsmD n=1 Tax=Sinomonas atrocyanea TaxID=37927 RepID=UPI002780CD58|nr:16S rRNA (guanine(966)-N(2))-methyltransferase RsmD [Sinomonas atrocyanea]MDQ0258172.1 16S rRNA (guanine966-N2)-methyltransferase [Sinomonas atrocyanea]MDR6623086.1 16S rRNA (guanine966-N2)-methyltransferase [Sinomonas atrocyanea]
MSRIIAGIIGGTPLASVPGSATRPTTDRVKEALFSRLDALGMVSRARVLDLYAGSGALGVEAVSRGASTAELVEADAKAVGVCQRNARLVNDAVGRRAVTVHRGKVGSFLDATGPGRHWDLVFMDPPYPLGEDQLARVLEALAPHLAEDALVVVERSSRSPEPDWPHGLEHFGERKYGETRLWFAEPVADGAAAPSGSPEAVSP